MDWEISETGQPDRAAADRLGNKLLTGNGLLGYRGTLEEYSKDQKTATILAGLYDRVGELWREPVNLPNGCFLQVVYASEALHAQTGSVIEHRQCLDLASAVHTRRTVFATGDGTRLTVRSRRFVSLARLALICLETTLEADRDCELTVLTGIDGDVWDLNGPHLCDLTGSERDGLLTLSARTHEKAVPLAVSEWTEFSGGDQTILPGEKGLLRELRFQVRAIQPVVLQKYVAHATGLEGFDPVEASQRLCQEAAKVGFETLLAEHAALWARRWVDCDISIQGDPQAEQALRFSLYHLLAVAPTHADTVSIPARGLSGQVYKGAIFWDTEIFMLPFFTQAFPEIARNLLMYRYRTLEGARCKARQYGYRGAFYAWESQDGGEDACTLFNVTDVFTNRPMRTYFRDKQIHISADVAHAFWQYYQVSGDASLWAEGGAEVVCECARFFLSAVYYHPGRGRYELLDVTGPDEYHERVHNNFYTNAMAARTFEIVLRVADFLRDNDPEKYRALLDRLEFSADLEAIREVLPKLYLPAPEGTGRVIPQFDGYFTLEDLPLEALLGRKLNPYEYLGGGNGLATTTQILKQADVVLALALLGDRYSLDVKSANWDYYEPRTEHGSTLSACSYSLIAAQLGRADWAYRYFMKTATIDLTGEGKEYVGTLYIGGTHPAANGGAWLAAVQGLCGLTCADGVLHIHPHLPEGWEEVSLPLVVQGQKLRLRISSTRVLVQALGRIQRPLTVETNGSRHEVPSSGELNINLPREPRL